MRTRYWYLIVLLSLCLGMGSCGTYRFRGTALDPANPAPPISLQSADGAPFALSQERGKVVVLFFGFTNCPDVCPAELAELKSVRAKLGDDATKLQVLFITVDPERDTPTLADQYAKRFDPSFIGLSGTREQLESIYKAYGVTAERRELPNSALGYTIDHSAFTYVIDPAGQWRLLFSMEQSIEERASDIQHLLQ